MDQRKRTTQERSYQLTTMGCHEIGDKFLVAYLGGVAPDLVMFQTFDIVAFADQGTIHPIDAYME